MLGAGEIFVEFEDTAGATKGRQALAGRSFNGKAVKATFFPHDLFQVHVTVMFLFFFRFIPCFAYICFNLPQNCLRLDCFGRHFFRDSKNDGRKLEPYSTENGMK